MKKNSIHRFVASLTLLFCVSQFVAPRSEALVGLIFKNRTIKVIGGLGALGGATFGLTSYAAAVSATTLGSMITLSLFTAWGIALGGFGVILLDDQNTVADIEFETINIDQPDQYLGFTRDEAEIYNQELPMLNAIRQTIASEVNSNEDTSDSEALWLKYSKALNPATFSIAKVKAKAFVESFAK